MRVKFGSSNRAKRAKVRTLKTTLPKNCLRLGHLEKLGSAAKIEPEGSDVELVIRRGSNRTNWWDSYRFKNNSLLLEFLYGVRSKAQIEPNEKDNSAFPFFVFEKEWATVQRCWNL